MPTLKCNKRDKNTKTKALRREGYVPGVIYGKNLKESVGIQINQIDVFKFLKDTSVGSLVTVNVDDMSYSTMLKQVDFAPMSNKTQHIDFQVVTAGEKVNTSAPIHFINQDKAPSEGRIQERINIIEYECLPKDIIDFFEVDLGKLEVGTDIKLEDLDVYKDDKYNFITAGNTSLVGVEAETAMEETSDEEESSEPTLIGQEEA